MTQLLKNFYSLWYINFEKYINTMNWCLLDDRVLLSTFKQLEDSRNLL